MDKAVGKAKETYAALTGDEAKKAEGRAEQRKGGGGGPSEGEDQASGGRGQAGGEGAR